MFEFAFMRRTILVGFLLAISFPLIGIVMVSRKTSMMGDALSHTSLTGVALGLILGINPSLAAILICVISAFSIESLRSKFPQYGDMATAVIMSIGLGLASILSDFTPGGNSLESYLFGSISSSSPMDVLYAIILCFCTIFVSIKFYASLLGISIDKNIARLDGVKVNLINALFTLLTAVTVALSTKSIGALLISSLLVIPVASALFLARSYREVYIFALALSLVSMFLGLVLSWYFEIKPGGAIILIASLGLLLSAFFAYVRKKKQKSQLRKINT